ncbi:hypothetical protein AMAG_02182 [Allomyces macrogynus ATCC 38327]|uniref:F-box domain-containing protein n=1 Tax=Allomyces macrogynus (strain ATCC 38327) TaxID=578462 RepID=A0A0L0S1E8_ALLM3|nr:hypothetical protein AMAG_02182 [Allomyces macrogynus ATCC 38327]|eukprot:KNE56368.1 hypothetical protein AMAG_02182 [Allomyces macrogynus ATCC 38327]
MSDSPPPTTSTADDLLAALHAMPPAELQDLLLALLPSLPPEHLQAVTHKARHLLLRDFVALLPPEVALAILARLRVPDLVHAAHVSHAWHALASDHGLWRDLYHRHGWTAHAPPLPPLDAVFQPRRTQDPLLADPPVPRSVASVPGTRPWIPPPVTVAHEDGCPADADLDCWPYLFQQRHRLLRNMRHGTPSLTVFEGHREGIYCIQADPFKLISGSRDNTVRIWNLRSNATTHVLEGHAGSVLCLEYNATHLVTGSSDRSIRVWSVPSTHDDPGGPSWEGPDDTYRTSTILHGHAEAVLNLRMDPKHHRIVSCSKDSTIRVWDWHRGACIRALEGHVAAVNAVQMRHDTVVSVSGDRTVRVWDLRDHHRGAVHQLVGHVRGVACVAFDGTTIASGSSDATIRLWDLRKAGGAPVPAHAVPTNGLPVGYQSTVPGAAVAQLAPPPIAPNVSFAADDFVFFAVASLLD